MRTRSSDKKKKSRPDRRVIAGLVLLAALAAGLFFFHQGAKGQKTGPLMPENGRPGAQAIQVDTGAKSVAAAPDAMHIGKPASARDTARHAARGAETALLRRNPSPEKNAKNKPAAFADTVSGKTESDTARMSQDNNDDGAVDTSNSGSAETDAGKVPGNCGSDTLALWVFPEPSGGLHHGKVAIRFQANKPCSISWRTGPDTAWREWDGGPVAIERTTTLVFKAIDRCAHAMETRQEYYEIGRKETAGACPDNMDLVKIGSTQFCIDRYEWPNRKGAVPFSYVSLYQARDSCFAAGKRLCSSEEWSLACSGPYSWNYPYGQDYERYACVTHDTTARPSGSKPECRAYFGTFDMAGNLLEWTNTPAKENNLFNNVMGGFWQSGPRSGCFDIRYSYFPQNRHNPVGFRCCKGAVQTGK